MEFGYAKVAVAGGEDLDGNERCSGRAIASQVIEYALLTVFAVAY